MALSIILLPIFSNVPFPTQCVFLSCRQFIGELTWLPQRVECHVCRISSCRLVTLETLRVRRERRVHLASLFLRRGKQTVAGASRETSILLIARKTRQAFPRDGVFTVGGGKLSDLLVAEAAAERALSFPPIKVTNQKSPAKRQTRVIETQSLKTLEGCFWSDDLSMAIVLMRPEYPR
jgi:hypothetical protein